MQLLLQQNSEKQNNLKQDIIKIKYLIDEWNDRKKSEESIVLKNKLKTLIELTFSAD